MVLRHGLHGGCFALAPLLPVLPSEPRDNLKIELSDKLCDNTAKISALFGGHPQNPQKKGSKITQIRLLHCAIATKNEVDVRGGCRSKCD